MKFSANEKRWIWITVGIVVVVIFFIGWSSSVRSAPPSIDTAHVINLDRDVAKLDSFRNQEHIPSTLQIIRWKATYGKDLRPNDMSRAGIGGSIFLSGKGKYVDQQKDLRNLGAIGCFLSHRSLLEHLANTNHSDSAGHLVLEDDAKFTPHWLHEWDAVRTAIPTNWDMVYLGIVWPKGRAIRPGVLRLEPNLFSEGGHAAEGNYGTHAYVVRHGAIRTKILPWLQHMVDTIDRQYNYKFHEWNVYAIQPTRIDINETLGSTIQTM